MRTTNTPLRRLLWGAAGIAAVAASAACSAAEPAASADPTSSSASSPSASAMTPSVATPAETPGAAATDALTAQDAWQLCYDAVVAEYGDTSTVFGYTDTAMFGEPTVTDQGDGSFQVWVAFAPTSGGSGAEASCVAAGTVGDPDVELTGGRDAG